MIDAVALLTALAVATDAPGSDRARLGRVVEVFRDTLSARAGHLTAHAGDDEHSALSVWRGARDRDGAARAGLRVELTVPLVIEGATAGAIDLYYGDGESVEPIDAQLLETAGIVAGRAIERCRLRRLSRVTRELERSNTELDRFAYVTSHDLKAPLRGIAHLAAWLAEDLDATLDAESRRHFALLQRRVHRMEALIDAILTYSRAGRSPGDAEPVDTGELVRDVLDVLELPADVELLVADDLPTVVTAPAPLRQVFQNLLENALKHAVPATDRPRIEIDWRDPGGSHVEMWVRDNGPGIERRYHGRIFDIFQTLRSRDEVEGAGIGLALARKQVEQHGGELALDSDDGDGATFRFSWPKEDGPHEQ